MFKDIMNAAKDKLEDLGIDELSDLKKLAESDEAKKALKSLIAFLEKNDKDTVVALLKKLV